uniref:Alpha-xylosidase n=1 Tax=Syphacia muris TaxID=451379 RepID=A0A0N5AR85_9BILA
MAKASGDGGTIGSIYVEAGGKYMHVEGLSKSIDIQIGCSLEENFKRFCLQDDTLSVEYSNGTLLQITLSHIGKYDVERYRFKWSNPNSYHYMKDVINAQPNCHWYGGPQLPAQQWPIARDAYKFAPYVSDDVMKASKLFALLKESGNHMSGMERYWLCSCKLAVSVPEEVPLWSQFFEDNLSLQAQIRDSPYIPFLKVIDRPILEYALYKPGPNVTLSLKEFHMIVHKFLVPELSNSPDSLLIDKPIWTTWARYKTDITQGKVLTFAEEIKKNCAEISQLELDDGWMTKHGDFKFDPERFPDVSLLCEILKKQGIRVTLWVHPFIAVDSETARDPTVLEICVKNIHGFPSITSWWHGYAYVVDFTNPRGAAWFRERLKSLKELGIYSFKFDAGEVTYLPEGFCFHSGKSPNDFSRAYVQLAAEFGDAIEARVFSRCQQLPIFFRTLDRKSTWEDCGLNTVIPVALNFSLLGYSFNIADIIGGNGYEEKKPDKELYIRWMQANLFLLTMQFSYTPWDFDEETCSIFHYLMSKRRQFLHHLRKAVAKCCETGEPAICPLWWLSEDEEALSCNDQFVINSDVIVAPVLEEGAKSRQVFLPNGTWQYPLTGEEYKGPIRVDIEVRVFNYESEIGYILVRVSG